MVQDSGDQPQENCTAHGYTRASVSTDPTPPQPPGDYEPCNLTGQLLTLLLCKNIPVISVNQEPDIISCIWRRRD